MESYISFNAPYYTRNNLQLLLGANRRTLDYRLSRLVNEGILELIKPGFYLNKKTYLQSLQKEAFLEYIGSVIKYPSYVSLEYALSKYGLIAESIYIISYVSTKKPKMFTSNTISYKYRNIKPELFCDYEKRQFNSTDYLFAKNYKAIFDFIYLTPTNDKNSLEELLLNSRINWNSLSAVDKESFIAVCQKSQSNKMTQVVKILKKEQIL